jgi:hypothetical protein
MTRERLTIPEQNVRDYAHDLAYKLAREQLAGIADIEEQCRKSGAQYLPSKKVVSLDHLNRSYLITYPSGEISLAGSDESVPIKEKILILDYFTRAKGTAPTGKTITYKELHDGINYYPTFSKRTIEPIVTYFGDNPEQLLETAKALGGKKAEYGDVSVTFNTFPRVPITFILWRGDKEFPPEGSIFFDSTIPDYLSNDDIHSLCEGIVWKMVRVLKTGGDNSGKG